MKRMNLDMGKASSSGFGVFQGCRQRIRRGSRLIRRLRWSEAVMISSLPMCLEVSVSFLGNYCVEGALDFGLGTLNDHVDPVAPIV